MDEIDIGAYKEVKILAGSHNKITIEKLYGPTIEDDLVIEWEKNGWNIINKQKVKDIIDRRINISKTNQEFFDEGDELSKISEVQIRLLLELKIELGIE